MIRYFLVLAGILLLALPGPKAVHAEEQLLAYQLDLAGYRAGMSIDDAALVRPFQYVQTLPGDSSGESYTVAVIDHLVLEDIAFDLRLYFRAGHLDKLIARFDSDDLVPLVDRLSAIFGRGRDLSRVVQRRDGSIYDLPVWRWEFPDARVTLVGSTGSTHGTLALSRRGQG